MIANITDSGVAGVYAPAFVERILLPSPGSLCKLSTGSERVSRARVAGVYAPAFVERDG